MIIEHYNCGFFSCFNVTLYKIMEHYNKYNSLPETVDTSGTYDMYKINHNDITYDFFQHYGSRNITFDNKPVTNCDNDWGFQCHNYKNIQYNEILPFIQKYFFPSDKIMNIQNELILKYNLNFDKCIAMYYRGTDKSSETPIDSFDSFYNKLLEVIRNDQCTDLKIIVQTDSAQFLEFVKLKKDNIIVIVENTVSYTNRGIHNEKSRAENYTDMLYFLSTVLILSKCKHILCSSGNVSIAIMFYRFLFRNSIENIHQNYNLEWL